jgi:uncharacterized membrane protein
MIDSVKHLDYIQSAITRMAGNAFTIKGWSITVTTAVIGVASKSGDEMFAVVGVLPIMLFWGLDAYYLSLERRFRQLFALVADRIASDERTVFNMSPGPVGPRELFSAIVRPTQLFVHGPLFLAVLGVFLFGILQPHQSAP